jgi:hypothetical protein
MSRFHSTDFDFLPEQAFRPRPGGSMTLEGGGKGSSAPPPDPRLVDAQIRSMGIQDDMIRRMVANSDEMQPLQMEQMRFGLDSARESYNQSQDDRRFALARRDELVTAQRPLLEEATNFNEGRRRNAMMAEANTDIATAFDVTRGQGARALERKGVAPNSGRHLAFQTQANLGEALARAAAGRKVSEAAKAEGMALRTNAVNMLSGYPAMASGLSGSGFQFGTGGIGVANAGLSGVNSGYGSAAGVAGSMGQNATGMFSAQAQYKSAQDKIAADSDPMNTILGAATAVGARMALASDRRLKMNITRVGTTDSGLPLYRYQYKWGGAYQIGVMADDVARLAPQAYLPGAFAGYDGVDYSKL